jgi:hypothetical protein
MIYSTWDTTNQKEIKEKYRTKPGMSWDVEDDGRGKTIIVKENGVPVIKMSGYEVLEVFGKRFVEEHTKTCNKLKGDNFWWNRGE